MAGVTYFFDLIARIFKLLVHNACWTTISQNIAVVAFDGRIILVFELGARSW